MHAFDSVGKRATVSCQYFPSARAVMGRISKKGGKVLGKVFGPLVVMFNSRYLSGDSSGVHQAADLVNVCKHPACKAQRMEAAFQTCGEPYFTSQFSRSPLAQTAPER